jgi:hypothetical protein
MINRNRAIHRLETMLDHIELVEQFLREKISRRDFHLSESQIRSLQCILEDVNNLKAFEPVEHETSVAYDVDHRPAIK